MMLTPGLRFNEIGHLTIEGLDAVSLAKEYGTPLYVINEKLIRNNCKRYTSFISDNFKAGSFPCYASKALSCLEIYRVMKEENMGVDVVSGGELYTALKAGFPSERIFFHGNNKTPDELNMAVKNNVGRVIVDSLTELQTLNEIAIELNCKVKIGLRIKPGIEAHTHDYIKTGQIDSKFGFSIENGEALSAVKTALNCSNLELCQLHCHIGSQIFDTQPFADAVEVMLGFFAKIYSETGIWIKELNLGGGLGARYIDTDSPLEIEEYLTPVANALHEACQKMNIPEPVFHIEPGRSIVGEAGTTLYTVGNIKEIENVRTYVSVDGGMADNIRYALYKADYTVLNASRSSGNILNNATIAGKCCESGDLIQEGVDLIKPEVGDTLAVLTTGAYNYSMASNYNRSLKPAMIMVNDCTHRLIIKRETYDDVLKNDI
ncbi:MAG: diaminopimelate decarboxylase [Ruminococcus sp.]|nr:diaminopimelate decarboxylase [Ruminococcus sp.]